MALFYVTNTLKATCAANHFLFLPTFLPTSERIETIHQSQAHPRQPRHLTAKANCKIDPATFPSTTPLKRRSVTEGVVPV